MVDFDDYNEEKECIYKGEKYSVNSVKAWFINVVTFENNLFVHTPYKSCFTNEGAEKYYTIALGKEWTGGDVFDDFC